MKTIIVATDYSEPARNATHYAAALARSTGAATLMLYHSFFLPVPISDVPTNLPSEEELYDENLLKLEAVKLDLAGTYGIRVECFASPLPVVDGLPPLVKRLHADLVVVGMGSLSEFDRRVFGSTATRLIGEATFPVLVVPEATAFEPLTRILFACDQEAIAPGNELPLLRELASAFSAQVDVLHVETNQPATASAAGSHSHRGLNLETVLSGISHQYTFLQEDDVVTGIAQGIREDGANLLVMVPRRHGFWDIVFNRSTTRKMAYQAPVPLLVLANPRK
jgi:nucleotide-binding universal stress UspA family protein